MRSRVLLWMAVGLGGAAVAALVLAGFAPPAPPAPTLQAKSAETLAQEALERELNRTLEKVGVQDIEALLLSAR